jgi:predicted restriction endonuclease
MAGTFVEACVLPEAELADQEAPDSLRDQEDQRERTWQEIVLRRGQQEFRQHLLVRYGFRCQMTGCDVTDVLEGRTHHSV